jgi:glycosyltransferase involved in cell wall biosynthesis
VPVVATAHAALFQLPWRWFDAVVAPSRATADYHARVNRVPRRRIHEVANAVRLPPIDPAEARHNARRALGIETDDFVIGTVGDISERKNQVDLLRAAARLPSPATLVLIGDLPGEGEPMPGWNEALAAAGARHRVVLAGKRDDGAALTAAFDLFGFVSRDEQGPIAPLEAMANGVPVLTYHVGNLPEIVEHGRTGFLVGQGDVDGFARLAGELMRDPGRLRHVGDEARRAIAATLSPPAMERGTAAVYRAVIGSRAPARPGR